MLVFLAFIYIALRMYVQTYTRHEEKECMKRVSHDYLSFTDQMARN